MSWYKTERGWRVKKFRLWGKISEAGETLRPPKGVCSGWHFATFLACHRSEGWSARWAANWTEINLAFSGESWISSILWCFLHVGVKTTQSYNQRNYEVHSTRLRFVVLCYVWDIWKHHDALYLKDSDSDSLSSDTSDSVEGFGAQRRIWNVADLIRDQFGIKNLWFYLV